MNVSAFPVTVQPRPLEKVYPWEDQPVLVCRLSLPQVTGPGQGPRRIDRYYRHLEQRLLSWLSARHAKACCLAEEALAANRPIPHLQVAVRYQVALQDPRWLSILWQLETEGDCRQYADLWSLPDGTPSDCRRLLPAKLAHKVRGKPLLLTDQGVCAADRERWELIWSPQL